MIVKIGAWLYIINAVVLLSSVTVGPIGFSGARNALLLLMAGLYAAIGVGLLQRKTWARWWALGSSFLGWTLGSLMLIFVGGFLLFTALGRLYLVLLLSGFAMYGLFLLALCVAGVVISFKLFFYLCSEEGCEEFGVPFGSAETVAYSAATWAGIFILNGWMARDGSVSSLMALSSEASEADSERERYERERQALWSEEAERRRRDDERREREEQEGIRTAETESSVAYAEADGPEPGEYEIAQQVAQPAALPEPEPKKEESASSRILKCRDTSGGITFTQGYCPPGTRQVEMPSSE